MLMGLPRGHPSRIISTEIWRIALSPLAIRSRAGKSHSAKGRLYDSARVCAAGRAATRSNDSGGDAHPDHRGGGGHGRDRGGVSVFPRADGAAGCAGHSEVLRDESGIRAADGGYVRNAALCRWSSHAATERDDCHLDLTTECMPVLPRQPRLLPDGAWSAGGSGTAAYLGRDRGGG